MPQVCLEEPRQFRLSQQVDLDWGESIGDLTDIMDNRAPSKLFDGASILCAGALMLPQPGNLTHPVSNLLHPPFIELKYLLLEGRNYEVHASECQRSRSDRLGHGRGDR